MLDAMLKSKEFHESLSASAKLLFLFLIGLGNYRAVLFLVIFYCLKAAIEYREKHISLRIIFFPIFLLAVYHDFKYGQLWSTFNFNTLPLFVIMFIIVDYAGTKYINIVVERISAGKVFSYCNKCKFENIRLTTKCKNCGYENAYGEVGRLITKNNYSEQYQSLKPLLRDRLDANIIHNISLVEGEKIYLSLKVNFANGVYKDDQKKLCNHIVVTNKNVVFMQVNPFQRGWRWREKIQLISIFDVLAINKKIVLTERQTIRLDVENHTYEFFLWPVNRSQDMFVEYSNQIKSTLVMLKND